jgi:hypothetical protein
MGDDEDEEELDARWWEEDAEREAERLWRE